MKNEISEVSDDNKPFDNSKCDFYIPQKYISKNDTINLNFPDSLIRYFRTDANTLVVVRHDIISDSVDVLEFVQSVIRLPISENLEYSIHFENSPWGIKGDVKYNIHYLNGIIEDSTSHIIFEHYKNNDFCNKVNKIISKLDTKKGEVEEVSLQYEELMN